MSPDKRRRRCVIMWLIAGKTTEWETSVTSPAVAVRGIDLLGSSNTIEDLNDAVQKINICSVYNLLFMIE